VLSPTLCSRPPLIFIRSIVMQVIIAHDVDPIELVVWLPALCRK
jgi:hypothetical protein